MVTTKSIEIDNLRVKIHKEAWNMKLFFRIVQVSFALSILFIKNKYLLFIAAFIGIIMPFFEFLVSYQEFKKESVL